MDTKGIINPDWKRLYTASRCGEPRYAVTVQGSYTIVPKCKNWDCPDCAMKRIAEINSLIRKKILAPQVFVLENELSGKKFENWMTKHKPKVPGFFYVSFHKTTGKSIIISSHKLRKAEDSQRRSKVAYLKELSEYLLENHREIKNNSHSTTPGPGAVTERILFAYLPNKDLMKEYDRLKTDRARAEWLRETPNIKLTKLGRQFIRQYLGD